MTVEVSGQLGAVEAELDYVFKNKELLRVALTHRSGGSKHNERMEFMGDAVLGFVISADLCKRFPKHSESELTLMRAALVRGATLANIARRMDLGSQLILGTNERRSGVDDRDSVLADALEAVIAAVYWDGGMRAVQSVIRRCWRNALAAADQHAIKDAKTQLQEAVQAKGWPLPSYRTVERGGPESNANYLVECSVIAGKSAQSTLLCERGSAADVRQAEQVAAANVLRMLRSQTTKGQVLAESTEKSSP